MRKAITTDLPFCAVVPGRIESMEAASNDLWAALRGVTVNDLKALRPTPAYAVLIDALVDVRMLMGEVDG